MKPLIDTRSVVAVDTMVFIYFLEDVVPYSDVLLPLFETWEKAQGKQGLTSTLTLLELCVRPFAQGRNDAVRDYRQTLSQLPGLELVPLEDEIAIKAAQLRARYRFSTPDCIQLATAVVKKAELFVTNDQQLKCFEEIPVLLLADLIS